MVSISLSIILHGGFVDVQSGLHIAEPDGRDYLILPNRQNVYRTHAQPAQQVSRKSGVIGQHPDNVTRRGTTQPRRQVNDRQRAEPATFVEFGIHVFRNRSPQETGQQMRLCRHGLR